MKTWFPYDTTLRDGLQQRGLEITANDAIKLAEGVAELGACWIEGGFPSAGPEQMDRIKALVDLKLPGVRIAAFGRTRGTKETVENARDLQAILKSGAATATLVGKSRERDAILSLKTTPEENLKLIGESIKYMKSKGLEVIFDAEHFFDSVKENEKYAAQIVKTAHSAGADWIALCDTNGGASAKDIKNGIKLAASVVSIEKIGFHGHNDRGRAISNTEVAFKLGVRHLQGTINGYGERCGNTDLCTLIPNLYYDYKAAPQGKLKKIKSGKNIKEKCNEAFLSELTSVSKLADELLNLPHNVSQPWVGDIAFYSEAGMHVSGLMRDPSSYLHIDPKKVGNGILVGLSEQSGRANIAVKSKDLGFELSKDDIERVSNVHSEKLKEGFIYNTADASLALLIVKTISPEELNSIIPKAEWSVTSQYNEKKSLSQSKVSARFNRRVINKTAEGTGPVDALNEAFLTVVREVYPEIPKFQLVNYQVRIINPKAAAAAKVRVLIESSDGKNTWSTVGVHDNIIEASWLALLDSVAYVLYQNKIKTKNSGLKKKLSDFHD